jgi:hypothetical protein
MSNNRDLFAGAIAEAKAVKNMAIENAKAALEEAFTPQLKELFSAKLREMDMEEEESYENVNEEEENEDSMDEMYYKEEEIDEEINLEDLLKEIEEEETLNEAEEAEESEEEESEEEEDGSPLNLEDMTEEDLAKMIEDIMLEEFPQLAQMKNDEEEEGEEEDMEIDIEDGEEEMEEGISLDEILLEIENEEVTETTVVDTRIEELTNKLEESYTAINTLRSELNDINLLNAKLLYTNKIFKAKNLTESQKLQVLGSFDKTNNVKEVKLVYNTLNESLKLKTQISTNKLGGASKISSIQTVKKPIVESNEAYLRMQKLAGII